MTAGAECARVIGRVEAVAVPELIIRSTVEDDWSQVRALRLEMLEDTPIAFEETLEHARAQAEDEWRRRAARGSVGNSIRLAAILPDGRWVGTMGCYIPAGTTVPYLVGVYVAPDQRGARRGVTDAMLDAIDEWAISRGTTLMLEVHETNDRARAAYAKRGFVATGRTRAYPLPPHGLEVEMVKRLG